MILLTCPACRVRFKMRRLGRCPACRIELYAGDDVRHNLHIGAPKGYWLHPTTGRWHPVDGARQPA